MINRRYSARRIPSIRKVWGPARPGPARPGPARTGPDRTGPDRTGPDRTGPDRTGPDQTGPDRTGPDRTGPVLTSRSDGPPNPGRRPLSRTLRNCQLRLTASYDVFSICFAIFLKTNLRNN